MNKAKVLRVVVYFAIFKLMFLGLSLLMEQNFMQVFEIQNLGSKDFSFNDMYYRVESKEGLEKNEHFTAKKSVVLVNSGSLDREKFREQLSMVIHQIEAFEPSVVGVDHMFAKKSEVPDSATQLLTFSLESYPNIVTASPPKPKQKDFLRIQTQQGDVEFPVVHHSIRYYQDGPQTFGSKICKIATGRDDRKDEADGKFPIHYASIQNGIVHWQEAENSLYDINFKYLEASELFDSNNREGLKNLLRNKIVLVGHLGTTEATNLFDSEDKHPVPVDTSEVANRERIMAGVVIHANAIENILHPNQAFFEWKGWSLWIFTEAFFLAYLLFIMFTEFGKLFNIILLAAITFPIIYLVLFMMEKGVYVTMGVTLLQLLIVEEVLEIIDYFYNKLKKIFPSKKTVE
jgi:hypothetical protein